MASPIPVAAVPPPTLQYNFDNDFAKNYASDQGLTPQTNGTYFANNSGPVVISLTTNTPQGTGYALNLMGSNGGVNNYLDAGNPPKLNQITQLTLTCWINLQADPATGDRIVDKVGSAGVGGFSWSVAGGATASHFVTAFHNSGGSAGSVNLPGNVNASNTWVFLALTWDGALGTNNVAYYSGSSSAPVVSMGVLSYAVSTNVTDVPNPFRVGSAAAASSDRTPPAWLDDVRVYTNTVLSMADLEAIRRQNSAPGTMLKLSAGGIGSYANAANYGDGLVFEADVSPTPPDGESVMFQDGATTLGTGLLTNGVANFALSTLAVGTHTITASYSGDANHPASTSGVLVLAVVTPPSGYYLAWSDEFNTLTLDSQNWQMYLPGQFVDTSSGNTNAYCVPDAMVCNGSNLVQTVYTANGSNYMGMIMSQGRFTFKYGFVEASILRNAASGVDQCFWIQSSKNGAYVGNPGYEGEEVDIAEHWNADTNLSVNSPHGKVSAGVHWDGYNPGSSSSSGWLGTNLGVGYHTYALQWTPTNYQFFVDGNKTWQPNSQTPISQHSEYFILSSAIHGGFTGAIPAGGYGDLSNSFCTLNFDYVRYFAPTSTVFWNGSADSAWTNAANWVANRPPQAGNDIVFSYLCTGNPSVTLPQSVKVNSLTVMETPSSISINGGNITVGSGGLDLNSASADATLNAAVALGAAQTWSVGDTRSLKVNGIISGGGSLKVASYGTVCLFATNTYTGATLISTTNGGRLALSGAASIAGTSNIIINAGATLDVSALTSGQFNFPGNASLTASGAGTMLGSNAAAIVGAPSETINLGSQPVTLIYSGAAPALCVAQGVLVLSNNAFTVNAPAPLASGVYSIIQQSSGNVVSTGSLTVSGTAIGPAMMSSLQVSGSSVNLLITNQPAPTLDFALSNGLLNVNWPRNYLGWILQLQTNGLNTTNPWLDIPTSGSMTSTNILLNPLWPGAFYRLRQP